ncbi:MAG: hypothetical protein Q9217_006928 [Psora testacea]
MEQHFRSRGCSLIDAPNAWTTELSDSGKHGIRVPPGHGQGTPWLPHGLNIPERAAPQTPWPVGGTINEVDASSTISPLSPKTPGDRSDIDVSVVPNAFPWHSAPPSSATYLTSQFSEFKQESSQHVGSFGNPLREIQTHPDEWPEEVGPTETVPGYRRHQFNQVGTGLDYVHQNNHGEFPGIKEEEEEEEEVVEEDTATLGMLAHAPDPSVSQDGEDEGMTDAEGDDDGEYNPSCRTLQTSARRQSHHTTRPYTRQRLNHSPASSKAVSHNNRVAKNTRAAVASIASNTDISPHNNATTITINSNKTNPTLPCPHCTRRFSSVSALNKHIQTSHTRPFTCLFQAYGCPQTFGSKNEWARHIRVQHLRLEIWQCDMQQCRLPREAGRKGSVGHEFDRKDLFTQHVRRMHSKLISGKDNDNENDGGGSSSMMNKTQIEMSIQTRCHRVLRAPPRRSLCPWCPGRREFDNWDNHLEHVGKHLESGDCQARKENEDPWLKEWLIRERLVSWDAREDGWRVVGVSGKKHMGKAKGRMKRGKRGASGEEEADADGETDVEI